jgi:medium-chain acyl-[acyl-carrier-protein] hydrolase
LSEEHRCWFRRQGLSRAPVQVFGIPYAGGGTTVYAALAAHLREEFELWSLRYPGRESRIAEAPIDDLPELTRQIATVVAAAVDRPFVLLGHSLGALVGFEVVRHLATHGGPVPMCLVVSGCRAPHVPARGPFLTGASEDEFVRGVVNFGGTPTALAQDPQARSIFVPTLRADVKLNEEYRPLAGPPTLPCPLRVLGGRDDPEVSPADLEQWRGYASRGFDLALFDGGHFFLAEGAAGDVHSYLLRQLQQLLPPYRMMRTSR